MTSLQNRRLCAFICALGIVSNNTALYLLEGHYEFDIFRDGGALVLLAWLFTGSNIARWIVGLLSAGAVIVGMVTVQSLVIGKSFSVLQRADFIFFGIALLAYGFVVWRLFFVPQCRLADNNAEPVDSPNHRIRSGR